MEFVEGKTLSEMKRLSLEEVTEVTLELAKRLRDLKSCGIIHNDLKPQNVF